MKKLSSVLARARSNNESVQSSPDVSRKYGIMGSFSTLGSMLTNVTITEAPEVFRFYTFLWRFFVWNCHDIHYWVTSYDRIQHKQRQKFWSLHIKLWARYPLASLETLPAAVCNYMSSWGPNVAIQDMNHLSSFLISWTSEYNDNITGGDGGWILSSRNNWLPQL